MNNLINAMATFSSRLALEAASILPLQAVLYVCIGLNIVTHLLSIGLSIVCVRNFGRGLKEKVFDSKADKFFQKYFSKTRTRQ
jgi:hypothetical protein